MNNLYLILSLRALSPPPRFVHIHKNLIIARGLVLLLVCTLVVKHCRLTAGSKTILSHLSAVLNLCQGVLTAPRQDDEPSQTRVHVPVASG